MKDFKEYFLEGESFYQEAIKSIETSSEEGLNFFLLQKAVENFLKSLMVYYGVTFPQEEYIDLLIESIQQQTTIKFPPFKEELLELAFVPYEGGCASSTVYEKRPESFIEAVDKLRNFVIEEIPVLTS